MQNNRSGIAWYWVVLVFLTGSLTSAAAATPVSAQVSPSPLRSNPNLSCGWHSSQNSSGVVASSTEGSTMTVTVGEPSWEEACYSMPAQGSGYSSVAFVAYEVFPVIVHGSPGTTVTLQAGKATPSEQQIAMGIRGNSIWTWLDPSTVKTDSGGLARSNLTLAGAVMPFVPNDIANVSLPIVASSVAGGLPGSSSTVGLPIEFTGSPSGGILLLQSPGPVTFGSGLAAQAGNPMGQQFGVVYSPPVVSGQTQSPLQVSLNVLGSYENGKVGPPPSDVQVSFPQPTFELSPNSIAYLPVMVTNSLKPSNASGAETYTFAVQERIGSNKTYLEPLTVSVSLATITFGSAAGTSSPKVPAQGAQGFQAEALGSLGGEGALVLVGSVLILGLTATIILIRHRKLAPKRDAKLSSS